MQQLDVYYELLSQHVSGIIMPIMVCFCEQCGELVN